MTLVPPELRRLYQRGRLIPFIGAGVSMSFEWDEGGTPRRNVSWRELVDYAAEEIGFDPNLLRVRGSDLQILEYVIARKGSAGFVSSWLSRFSPPDDDLLKSAIHAELAAMTTCPLIYTTNFDNYVERALRLHGRSVRVIATEHQLAEALQSVDVVKFHGDLNFPDKMVLSESHYEHRLRLDTLMDRKLRSDLLGKAVLFLGYSFRDPNVSYLLRLFNDENGPLPDSSSGKRGYIIVPNPSDFETRLFQKRNIEVIPVLGEDSGPGLTDQIASILGTLRK